MSALTFHWFLPTTGDSRHVVGGGHGSTPGTAGGDRPASIEYLGQIARTAEQLGFVGALTITRDTSAQAWAEAERLLAAMDPERVKAMQEGLAASESEGRRRMRELHNSGDTGNLEICPNLWAGVGLVRGGAGTALVGSHTEVADLFEEYHRLRIEEFVLSGVPHLEEACWFGEGVVPLLEKRGLWRHPAGPRPVEIVRSRGGRCRGRAVLTAPVAGPGGAHPGRQPGSAGVDGLRTKRVPQAGAGRSRCSRRVVPMYSVR
ncbi:Alkanesulfonate monooxygenase [Streptomyces sp. ADI93-02]|nr:Alkanesulfonate monooxygenase [Streptomyces sp. ADI93-02]